MDTIIAFLTARLREPSTYTALGGLLPLLGVSADWVAPITGVMTSIGMLLIAKALTPDAIVTR